MSIPYDLRPAELTPDELRATSALLRTVFPRTSYLTERYLAWLYLANPDGTAFGMNAWAGDELVGHIAGTALRARLEGGSGRGLFLLNAAVRPGHTNRGIMSSLMLACGLDAQRVGYNFLVGMGNALSTSLMLRYFSDRAEFQLVAPLQARIGFGAPRPRQRDAPLSFERIWSNDALTWRLANPERRYTMRKERQAISILAPTGRPGIAALLHRLPDDGRLAEARGEGRGPLRVWLGLDPGLDWRGSAYVAIPRRLRPSPLNFVYASLNDAPARLDPARSVFRAIDFDPF